jgi:Domain of unknown function (DUF397)
MTTVPRSAGSAWRKSSHSGNDTSCVEVHHTLGALQDTKRRGPKLSANVTALVAAVKAGQIG